MKKTTYLLNADMNGIERIITCEVTGYIERNKVWTELDENGDLILDNQYFLGKAGNKFYFYYI